MSSPTSIPIEGVEFHSLSYEDSAGRLFWRDGHLYRGLSPSVAAFYEELFESGVVDELVRDRLLVDSRMTEYTMAEYPRIVEHSVVPFVSYAHEWCPEMLRSAGRLVLDLAERLHSRGLELRDSHVWNILFRGPHPLWVDFCAIGPASPDSAWWGTAGRFREHFLNPLYLISVGAGDIARMFQRTTFNGNVPSRHLTHFSVQKRLTQGLRARAVNIAKRLPIPIQELLRERLNRHRSGGSVASHFGSLREELESIPLPQPETLWSTYYDGCFPPFEPDSAWNGKQRRVFELLTRIRPTTVIDMGSKRGWYAQLAARSGASVVAMDGDSACVSRLYADALANSLPVLPLIMDVRDPSPARGLCGELCPAAWERLICDLVLALAMVHDLVLRSRLTFDQSVRLLKRFSKRYVLVEFVNAEDYMGKQLIRAEDSWYTSDNFQTTLRRHFRMVEHLPSDTDTRELYFCEL